MSRDAAGPAAPPAPAGHGSAGQRLAAPDGRRSPRQRLAALAAGDAPYLAWAWLFPVLWLWPLPARLGGALPHATFWYDAIVVVDSATAIGRNLIAGRGLYEGAFFHPQPAVHTMNDVLVGPALLFLPLGAALGPWLAHNLVLLLSFGLTAHVTWRLVLRWAQEEGAPPPGPAERLAALAVAHAFAFCSYKAFNLARLQNELTFLLPLALLAARQAVVRGRARDGFALGAVLLAQATTCAYYALFLAAALPAVVVPEWLRLGRWRQPGWHVRIGVPLAGAAGLAWLAARPYVAARERLGIRRSLSEVREQSGDLQQLLWADRDTWLGHLPAFRDVWAWDSANFPGLLGPLLVVAGWGVLAALAAGGSLRRRLVAAGAAVGGCAALLAVSFRAVAWPGGSWLPWALLLGAAGAAALLAGRAKAAAGPLRSFALLAAVGVVALALYFGPLVHVRLQDPALGPGPFRFLFDHVPGFDGMRTVRRAAILLALALAAGGGVALVAAVRRLQRWPAIAVAGAALCLAVVETWRGPVPTLAAPTLETAGETYRWLAAHPDGRPIAELPGRKAKDDAYPTVARWLAQLHGHPTVNGHASYVPPLSDRLLGHLDDRFPTDVALAELRAAGVGWVVLHRRDLGAGWERVRRACAGRPADLAPVAELADGAVLELLPGPTALDPGAPAAGLSDRAIAHARAEGPGAGSAALALDGNERTRFALTTPQRPGLWLELELAAPAQVSEVVLVTRDRMNWPRGVAVDVDGGDGFRELASTGPLLPVQALVRSPVRYELPVRLPAAVVAKRIRLRLTGSDPRWWWSVHEVHVRGP